MKKINKNNTRKQNIINNIFSTIGVPTSYAKRIVDDFISIIIFNLIEKKQVKIKDFGKFNLIKKKKRIGRNPKTKINYEILARNVLTFKSAAKLSRKVNKDV